MSEEIDIMSRENCRISKIIFSTYLAGVNLLFRPNQLGQVNFLGLRHLLKPLRISEIFEGE